MTMMTLKNLVWSEEDKKYYLIRLTANQKCDGKVPGDFFYQNLFRELMLFFFGAFVTLAMFFRQLHFFLSITV